MAEVTAFFLFGGLNYYPEGGLLDYLGSFDTQEEAQDYGAKTWAENHYQIGWMHVATIRDSDHKNPYGLRLVSEANFIGKNGIEWKEVNETA